MQKIVSRRTILKGAGMALALPWLEAMAPRYSWAKAVQKPPVRMAFFYVPNGICMQNWTPAKFGKLPDELPEILKPLSKLRGDFSVVSGLCNNPGRAEIGHSTAQGAYLTAAFPRKTSGSDYRTGISVDQVAARRLAGQTRLDSLQLSCHGGGVGTGGCDGYSCAYMSTISWRDATTPLGPMGHPRQIFDRVFANDFGNQSRSRERKRSSILDFVLEEANSLDNKLGANDRRKLDEYFSAIRDIERRIKRTSRMPAPKPPQDFAAPDPAPNHNLNLAEHVRIHGDLMALAFQTDATRVCTFIVRNEFDGMSYNYAGIPHSHHHVSHHGSDKERIKATTAINKHHVEQFAYILNKLKDKQEGDGTLLDNCMIAYGSGNSDGGGHTKENLPLLLAGRAGGKLKSGRHFGYPVKQEVPLANMWISMLDCMNTPVDRFGDSTGKLNDL